MDKVLILLTSSFPFGEGETFLETEIQYLSTHFNRIIIISNDCINKKTREVPKNVLLNRYPYELKGNKILSLSSIFSIHFWQELFIIVTLYKLNINRTILNTLFISLHKAKQISKHIKNIIIERNLTGNKIYLYSYWNNDSALALALLKEDGINYPVISRAHGWDVYFEVNESKYLPYRKLLLNHLNAIFFVSKKGKNYFSQKLHITKPSSKLQVSHLGVKQQKLKSLDSSKKDLLLLSCSNIIPLKRIHLIIETLAIIDDINIKWSHIGEGRLRNELENQAWELLHKKDNINYEFFGHVNNIELLNYYKQNTIDLFINTSSSEGIPVSIMEAMSFGIPVIATAVGGTPEIVNDKNGILLSTNPTPEDIVTAIEKFYNLTSEQKTNKRESAYQTCNKKYNAEKNYREFIETILKL